jgi:hypothetical protein
MSRQLAVTAILPDGRFCGRTRPRSASFFSAKADGGDIPGGAHFFRLWHWKREQVTESGFPYAP